jgi:abequosyltransferase
VQIAELSDPQQRLAYLSEGMTSEAVFSFISSLIVRRDKWLSVHDPQEFMGSCWAHVARLFAAAQTQLRVCYVGEIWIDRRGENDSFRDRGIVNRLRIAVDGYHSIAERFFGHASPEAAEIRRMVRNDLQFKVWLHAKCRTREAPAIESRRELDRLMATCYGDPDVKCWLIRITYRLMPVVVYRMLRGVYRRMSRMCQMIGIRG